MNPRHAAFVTVGLALALAGCGGKKGPDLNALTVGATRADVEAQLGRPIESTLNPDGTRTSLYAASKPKPRGNVVTRSLGRGVKGLANMGLSVAGSAAAVAAPGVGGMAAGLGTSALQGALSGSGAPDPDGQVPEEYAEAMQQAMQQYMAMLQAQAAAQPAGAAPGAPGAPPVALPRVYPPNAFVVVYGTDERVVSYRQPAGTR